MTMQLQTYNFRLKTSSESFSQKNQITNFDNLLLYFKGEEGLTQTILLPLNKLKEEIYESSLELLDVGNVN